MVEDKKVEDKNKENRKDLRTKVSGDKETGTRESSTEGKMTRDPEEGKEPMSEEMKEEVMESGVPSLEELTKEVPSGTRPGELTREPSWRRKVHLLISP